MSVTGFNRRRRELAKMEALKREEEKKRQSEAGSTQGPALEEKSFAELRAAAKEAGIEGYGKMNKEQLLEALKAGG